MGLLLAELLLIDHFLVVDQQAQSSGVTPVLHTLQTYLLALDGIESKFMLRLPQQSFMLEILLYQHGNA